MLCRWLLIWRSSTGKQRARMVPIPRSGRWQRWPPRARAVAAVVAAAAILYASALALASRPGIQARLRNRIAAALRARVGEVSIGERVGVDALLRVSFGPVVVPPARDGAEPVLRIDSVRVRPALAALLGARVEPASVELRGVRVAPGPGGRDLGEILASGRATSSGHAAPAARESGLAPAGISHVRISDLVVAVRIGTRVVEVGPIDAETAVAGAGPDETRLRADVLLPGRSRIEIEAERAPSGWRARIRGNVGPDAIPASIRSGAAHLAGGTGSFSAEGDAPADLSRAQARVRVALDGVVLAGERIGPQPVGPLGAAAEGTLSWERDEGRVALADANAVILGALRVSAAGEARLDPGMPFVLSLRADGVDAGALVAALPASLAPPTTAPRPSGTLDARLDLAGPLVTPAAWTISASLDLSRMREAARRAPPAALRGDIVYEPEGVATPILVGPRNPDFVPIAELPEHVVRAVTTSEDAGFFAHQGFDFDELRNALAEGAEAGHVVRGGSTITQQLAKNLYLSPERTLARKVREAAIAIALEASLPKRRLLETYLNVVEWGPGLWGIGPAARHWFGKDARELTPREAAFLASIIPNPVRYHFMFAHGAPTDAWEQRVNELLLKMMDQGVISDDQLVDALYEPIVFAGG
jgi:hypothetical protein